MRLVIRSKSGFTLVELIVTITILAILGTIGFLSLGGYSAGARDATRSTDLANIAKALDTSTIASGTFPTPDNSFNVTFSGGSVWKQGAFADGAATRLNSSALNKAPTDPLTQKAYTYSVLSYGNAYSLKADYEGSAPVAIAPALIEQAHADAGTPNIVYVRGTYQGISAATQASNVYYVLAIPSIISSIGNPGDNIEISANLLSGKLLFSGKDISSPSTFNPNTVVYSGASLPEDDSTGGITTMVSNLKAAYASSDLAGTPNIKNVVSLETAQFAVAGATVINTQLGGKVQMDLIMNSDATSTGNTSTGNTSTGTSLLAIQIVNSANNSACALMSNRWVKCWGTGLALGLSEPVLTPTDVPSLSDVTKLFWGPRGWYCAMTGSGTLKCWAGPADRYLGLPANNTVATIPGLETWVATVSLGGLSMGCAVMTNGGVKCWWNGSWALGNGQDISGYSLPVDVIWLDARATSVVTSQGVGGVVSCALLETWAVKCWWSNITGALGDNYASGVGKVLAPVPSGITSGGRQIVMSGMNVCVLMDTGAVKCWWPELNLSAGPIATPTTIAWWESNVISLIGGGGAVRYAYSFCATMSSGEMKCIGSGMANDPLMQSSAYTVTAPSYLPSWLNFRKLSIGSVSSCFITSTGGVQCVGRNQGGQFWNGTISTDMVYVPANVIFP